MGFNNREVEIKLLIESGQSYLDLKRDLKKFMGDYCNLDYRTISGKSSDYYWLPSKGSPADFIRLRRRNSGKGGIITVKSTDKESNLNRIEIDLNIDDFDQGLELLTCANGPYIEKVTKKYHVFFKGDEHTNYSIYQVENDNRLFLEIEARTGKEVEKLALDFMNWSEYRYSCSFVRNSIFDMFVLKRTPLIEDLETGLSLLRLD